MSRPTYWTVVIAVVASGLLVLGASACSDTGGPSDVDAEFTGELIGDVGAAQTDEIEEAVATLELESGAGGFSTGPASFTVAPGSLRPRRGSCAEVNTTTDSDSDGTPDEATFTFALPACQFTNFRGGTLNITGVIMLSDPTPLHADFAVHLTLDDFKLQHTNPDQTRSYATTRNGTRALIATAAGATLTNTVTTVRSTTGRANATISHNLLLTFTPDEGQSLVRGEPLPSGHFEHTGMLTWTRNGRGRTFTVTTVVPLRRDANCTTDRKIAEGEIHWTLSNGSYLKTVWTGCGVDPTREFVRAG